MTIEGIDYIFDRYAYLGLPRTAARDEIEMAVRKRRSENHPDRLIGAGPEVQQAAGETRERVDACAAILLDDKLRPLYDERLALFETEHPRLVSRTGVALIDPSRQRIDIDALLDVETEDHSGIEKQVAAMAGYDEKRLRMLQRMQTASPSDPEAKRMLRDELTRKLVFLTVLEDVAWAHAGVHGKKNPMSQLLVAAEDYVDSVQSEILRFADEDIPRSARARSQMVAIGMAAPPLLLSGPGGKQQAAEAPRIAEMARRAFLDRSDLLVEVAGRKADCLRDLVALSDLRILNPTSEIGIQDGEPMRVYLAMTRRREEESETESDDADIQVIMAFLVSREGKITEDPGFDPPLRDGRITLEGLKHTIQARAAVVVHNPEIDGFSLEIAYAAESLIDMLPDLPEAHPESP